MFAALLGVVLNFASAAAADGGVGMAHAAAGRLR